MTQEVLVYTEIGSCVSVTQTPTKLLLLHKYVSYHFQTSKMAALTMALFFYIFIYMSFEIFDGVVVTIEHTDLCLFRHVVQWLELGA